MEDHPVIERSHLSANARDLLTIAGGIAAIGGVYYVYTLIKTPVSRAVHTVVGTSPSGRQTTAPVTPHTVTHTQVHTVVHTVTPQHTPAHTPVKTPISTPTHTSRAPQTLPSYVTRRCGTVYVSLGLWSPHRAGLAYIAKYTNGKLVAQYPQAEPSGSPWLKQGTWSGGYACAGSGSGSTYPNAPYWTNLGNGCYRAQSGATLSGLAAALGTNYQTLAAINHISNPNAISINQTVCAQGSGSGSGSGGSSGSPPQLVIESGSVS